VEIGRKFGKTRFAKLTGKARIWKSRQVMKNCLMMFKVEDWLPFISAPSLHHFASAPDAFGSFCVFFPFVSLANTKATATDLCLIVNDLVR
jgi:hypothetical protein